MYFDSTTSGHVSSASPVFAVTIRNLSHFAKKRVCKSASGRNRTSLILTTDGSRSSNNVDVPRSGGVDGGDGNGGGGAVGSDGGEDDQFFQEFWKVRGDLGPSSEEEASGMTTQSHQEVGPPGNRQHQATQSLSIPGGRRPDDLQ